MRHSITLTDDQRHTLLMYVRGHFPPPLRLREHRETGGKRDCNHQRAKSCWLHHGCVSHAMFPIWY